MASQPLPPDARDRAARGSCSRTTGMPRQPGEGCRDDGQRDLLSTNCASLFSSFLGEVSEQRELLPEPAGVLSVIFLDEIDALVGSEAPPKRRDATSSERAGPRSNESMASRQRAAPVAATNRPDRVDPRCFARDGSIRLSTSHRPQTPRRGSNLGVVHEEMPLGCRRRSGCGEQQDFTELAEPMPGSALRSPARDITHLAVEACWRLIRQITLSANISSHYLILLRLFYYS